jgi:hypothetical protein
VHRGFVLPGQTTNQKVHLRVLERPRQVVSLEISELLYGRWVLHHDSAPSHRFRSRSFWQQQQQQKCRLGAPPHTYHIFMWLHPVPYQEVLSPWITFWNHGRDSEGCSGRSKQLVEEWHLEILRQSLTTLKMGAVRSSETSVNFYQTTWRSIPEDNVLHSHLCVDLKSQTSVFNMFGSMRNASFKIHFY